MWTPSLSSSVHGRHRTATLIDMVLLCDGERAGKERSLARELLKAQGWTQPQEQAGTEGWTGEPHSRQV